MSNTEQPVREPGYCHPDYLILAEQLRGLLRRNADLIVGISLDDGVHAMRVHWVAGPHPATGKPANWPVAVDELGRAVAGDAFEVPPPPSSPEWRP